MTTEVRYTLTEDNAPDLWLTRLQDEQSFRLVALDEPVSEILDFYDSFDWLVFRQGLTLERLQGEQDRLVLRSCQSGELLEKIEQAETPPPFAADLPASDLRDRLMALFGLRAMLQVAQGTRRRHTFRLVNKELKERGDVRIVHYALGSPGNDTGATHTELVIRPLHGHTRLAQRLDRYLRETYSLQPEKRCLLEILNGQLARRPGEYSSKFNIGLDATERADAAMRKVFLRLLATMEENEAGTIGNTDTEFLHDYRVAVRRTRSALTQMKPVFTEHKQKRFSEIFAWLGTITTPTRDLDVYLLKFADLQASLPRAMRPDLEPLRDFLAQQQRIEQARLAKTLQSAAYRKLKDQWRHYLTDRLPARPTAADALTPIAEVAHRRTWRMYRRVLRGGRAITGESPADDLHELRKSCKKLRYLMEFFLSLYPPEDIRALIKELKGLQDNLGDFQDYEVQMQSLQGFENQMARQGALSETTRVAIDTLLECLHEGAEKTRRDFEARFTHFDRKANRKLFKRLFHPDTETQDGDIPDA